MFDFIRTFPFGFVNSTNRALTGYMRVLHASPGTYAIDIYANSRIIARSLSYKGFTEYFTIAPGTYKIEIFQAGHTINPLFTTNITIGAGTIQTMSIIGRIPTISTLIANEPILSMPAGKLYIRFAHLSPSTSRVDVSFSPGGTLFKDIPYKKIADYIPVNPGTYVMRVNRAGTNETLLYVPNIKLLAGKYYTFYLVGTNIPPLQILIPLDGNSYIKF